MQAARAPECTSDFGLALINSLRLVRICEEPKLTHPSLNSASKSFTILKTSSNDGGSAENISLLIAA